MPLHARRAEVVGARLHREAVHAHDRGGRAGVDELRHFGQHLVGDEVLARAVGVDDRLDQVLRHVLVVGRQLLCALGQAAAAVAKARVVAVAANARPQAHALDDLGSAQPARACISIELVKISNAQRQIRVAGKLNSLRFGGVHNYLRNAMGTISIRTVALSRICPLLQQADEPMRPFFQQIVLGMLAWHAADDTRRMQVVKRISRHPSPVRRQQ